MAAVISRWWKRLTERRWSCVFGDHPVEPGQRGIAVAGGVLCERCFWSAQAALRPAESSVRCTCCRRKLIPGTPRSAGAGMTICPACLALAEEIFASDAEHS